MEDKAITQFPVFRSQDNGTHIYSQPVITTQSYQENDEEINIRQLWSIVKHRSRLIAAVAIGLTALIGVWTFTKTPSYEGKFQLLVGKPIEDNPTLSEDQMLLEGLGMSDKIDYETQIEVLRSPSILRPIIEEILRKYPDFDYKEFFSEKKSPLKISQVDETKILEITYEDVDREKIEYILGLLSDAYLKYSLDERKTEVNQGIDFVQEQLPRLRKQVQLREKQLQQFRQRYNLLDPEQQSEQLAEQLSQLEEKYFDTQVQLNETNSLYKILEQQIGLNPDQAIAASYLSESPRYQNLLNQLQEVELELAKETSRFTDSTPIIQTLKEKRDNLLPLLQVEAQKVLGNRLSGVVQNTPSLASPSTLRLELNQMFVKAANEGQILQIRRMALEQQIATLKSQIRQMPILAREYTELQRELTVETESLNRFLEAQEKLQIDGAQKVVPWKLIAKPELKEDAVSPKPVRNIALGLVAGVILGLGAAFLAERLDPVFHSTEELKDATKLPFLGAIPLQKDLQSIEKVMEINLPKLQIGNSRLDVESFDGNSNGKEHQRNGYKTSGFLEAFRSLNTNIRLLGSDYAFNSFVVSSAEPGDGKSTISSNLAQAAAAMGQRVLIVDADLRRPQVHHRLGIENGQGLSNILATGLALEEAIQPVPQWENLSVITAGDIPPDPTRLLASKRMQQVMEELKQKGWFDLIIYDTPPVLGFADGRILAAATNGIVLVARLSKTDRSAVKNCIDQLKLAQVPILGLVANGVTRSGSGSYYYSYYYSHYYSDRKE
ncbi:MAG: polysaccharide biosynthesis tyrosine autokinase [Hydrococcus sp. RU_2_2]|nr:polysaccharide biosynthesis tyrosine autokinase [Hydrococcus sp. RU_2_2]NJP18587.1 polysaccharide biosynthesis tyrosine autokinase [Hydrococcus sp. CRU_1_1]